MNIAEIIRAPMVTERSTILKEKFNQYVFKVTPDSTKSQIKDVIEKYFKVKVEKVRTSNYTGKMRRLAMGRPEGRRADWKKAFVTVKKSQEKQN